MLESKKLVPKKNHHFVWRRYLENWQVDNKLAYFATKKHIAATETALGVAKQDFFYKLEHIENYEDLYIKIILKFISDSNYEINLHYYNSFKAALKQSDSVNNWKINLLENYHSKIEGKMLKVLPQLSNGDFNILENSDYFKDFMNFLGHQATRTKDLKDSSFSKLNLWPRFSLNENFRDEKDIDILLSVFRKHWWFFSFVFGQNYALNLLTNCNIDIHIPLINSSDISFITSDSPVVSLKSITGNGKDLYFPISPKFGYVILRDINTKFFNELCTTEDVKLFNSLIVQNSHQTYFADSESSINEYKKLFMKTH
ncbi:DUF4238 domain-containing protein [Pseudoalteromonas sp. SG44-1]|uniref:DUF4238 domain-containing protein n=1 Tax=unclassified Pseudoalteromonas TaxID=194690 RepID=UPI0016033A85|nr:MULTISPECIES: DUF4238 domain-containing protein [unclassified Pseudoalteromonas]MBB1417802.1 DUF4238 domain-containing protein [Pseudoalteromonas sp. SG44-1]MBB1434369.1 DUF4238 domain-containing protein [Pseudoalteromonas sp. SG43-6]